MSLETALCMEHVIQKHTHGPRPPARSRAGPACPSRCRRALLSLLSDGSPCSHKIFRCGVQLRLRPTTIRVVPKRKLGRVPTCSARAMLGLGSYATTSSTLGGDFDGVRSKDRTLLSHTSLCVHALTVACIVRSCRPPPTATTAAAITAAEAAAAAIAAPTTAAAATAAVTVQVRFT